MCGKCFDKAAELAAEDPASGWTAAAVERAMFAAQFSGGNGEPPLPCGACTHCVGVRELSAGGSSDVFRAPHCVVVWELSRRWFGQASR